MGGEVKNSVSSMILQLLISQMVKKGITYIKEDNITVRISVMPVNTIKSLRELNIAYFLP